MENFLYLLEVFVETVTFSSNLPQRATAADTIVSAEIGKFVKMDLFTMEGSSSIIERENGAELNCGKSTLFACTSAELIRKLKEYPLVLSVSVKMQPSGSVIIKWPQEFFDLINKSVDTFGVSGPVTMQDKYILKEKNTDKIMGDMKATIKLSSFGSSVQTNFQLINAGKDANKKFLVRGARGETTLECQKFGDSSGSELLPVTPLLSSTAENKLVEIPVASKDEDRLSWMALFKSTIDPKFSNSPEEFNVAISNIFDNRRNSSALTFDIVSLMERPEENKYIDLRIRGGSRGFVFEFDTVDDIAKESKTSQTTTSSVPKELTADRINKLLCKNKDCPAVRKFKEMGLGPLATTKGLGAVMGETSLPLTYGLSQTYGVFDEYGPYGLFSRPKRPDNPFVPKQDNDWKATCWKPKRQEHHEDCGKRCTHCPPLRLTGGGVLDYDDVKSPFHECKEIMDQFDDILVKYKNALGPCGKTTCPLAPNVAQEICKKMCRRGGETYSVDSGSVDFPVRQEEVKPDIKFKTKPACGSPKCAYAKYKSGLVDEDIDIELQHLPPGHSGKCGHPKCPFPVQPDLPPIHWDCPDPLPKEQCKNPNCPYLPKEIKCLNSFLAKGPCGNLNCPYSPPSPCSSPNCPFASKECPYEDSESLCGNSDCPYAPKNENDTCDNPSCPFAKKEDPCGVTYPPYYTIPCPIPPCSPFTLQNFPPCTPQDEPCMMQNFPAYFTLVSDNQTVPCPLPNECQFSKPQNVCEKKPSPCYAPPKGPCGNPVCPHPTEDTADACGSTNQNEDNYNDVCENPECLYAPKTCYVKPPKYSLNPDEVCDNSECPYAPPPPCPYPCPYPYPYLQNLLAFGMPVSLCPDEVCPYPDKDLFEIRFGLPPCPVPMPRPCGAAEESVKEEICENPECQNTKEELGDGVEYTSGTRTEVDNTPCRGETCKSQGGNLVCDTCPCTENDEKMNDEGVEYWSDTRLEVDLTPCNKKTCKSTGGALVCEVCPCSKGGTGKKKSKEEVVGAKKKKKRKSRRKYVYSVGDKHPGVRIGHRECIMPSCNVPPGMGWLWNIYTPCGRLRPRRGWRPGAIAKTIADRIRKHREAQGLQMLEIKDIHRGKKGYGTYESGTSINVQPKPTLHIKKHEGCYYITMNPLKDPYTLVENENPYMDCTPMQFKIMKNKDKAKTECGNDEYKSCFCGEDEVKTSSSESELEIEFTPPAGIIHPERFKRKHNVVHCDTQYLASDFEKKSEGGKSKKGKNEKGKKGKGKEKKGGKKGGKKGKKKKK